MAADPTMDEEHEAKIKTILKLPEAIAIPDETVERYWKVKRAADRIGARFTDMDLVWIAVNSGTTIPPVKKPDFNATKDGIDFGQAVEARWKFGRWHKGVYHGTLPSGQVLVQFDDGTAEDREFAPEHVRLVDG